MLQSILTVCSRRTGEDFYFDRGGIEKEILSSGKADFIRVRGQVCRVT